VIEFFQILLFSFHQALIFIICVSAVKHLPFGAFVRHPTPQTVGNFVALLSYAIRFSVDPALGTAESGI
jgi:hypothetical protein